MHGCRPVVFAKSIIFLCKRMKHDIPLQLQQVEWEKGSMELWLPDAAWVQQHYYRQKQAQQDTAFPYWSQVWPAALAMAAFLQQHVSLIRGKCLLELAAGLGLPSLVAARYAQRVCCSDYLPEAVKIIQQSAIHNGLHNVECRVLDWNHLPPGLSAEVLLLSDINYDPAAFEQLYRVLLHFIHQGTLVLISTPQRLMAKPFIQRLQPWCLGQEEMQVLQANQAVSVSLLVLGTAALKHVVV